MSSPGSSGPRRRSEDGDPGVAHAVLLDLRDELLEDADEELS